MPLTDAIAKLKNEMEQSKNPYITVIGEFLIDYLNANPGSAEEAVMNPEKSIAKSLDAMKNEARKKQVNGCAMLTDAEGFAIVLKYFGIDPTGAVVVPNAAPIVPEAKPAAAFDVRLEDFL